METHAGREAELVGEPARAHHQLVTGLDAVDAAVRRVLLEEQVVEDEAEVGLARAVVHKLDVGVLGQSLGQQRFDELVEVIDLLQLAPAVLVELAVAGEDVQLLEQLEGLLGTDFGVLGGHGVGRAGKAERTPMYSPRQASPSPGAVPGRDRGV